MNSYKQTSYVILNWTILFIISLNSDNETLSDIVRIMSDKPIWQHFEI